MKLSEAILLGIGVVTERRQIFFMNYRDERGPCGCAIGTALYAAGRSGDYEMGRKNGVEMCVEVWPWTAMQDPTVQWERSVAEAISLRHNLQNESRESIAAWVATIEPSEEPTVDAPKELAHHEN